MFVRMLCVGALMALSSCGRATPASSSPQNIELQTSDGVTIADTYYPVASLKAPGIILIHMLGTDRSRWETFANQAQHAGYACIAFDMRGHGESVRQGDKRLSYRTFTTTDWLGVVNDIDAAKRMLVDKGADPDNIVLVGASIGANLALRYAVLHPEIVGVALLSPGLDYHGVTSEQPMQDYGKRPSLLMSSDGDSYSASTCTRLKDIAPGYCELRQYPGGAHGTDLLDASESARRDLLSWLDTVLHGKTVGAPATGTP